jgi:hypothetical protein
MTTPDELERLAKYASSGPWTVDERLEAGCVRGRYGDIIVMETELLSDAAFIAAANPATVLALLSERAELLATVERMRGGLEKIATNYGPGHLAHQIARAALTTGEEK